MIEKTTDTYEYSERKRNFIRINRKVDLLTLEQGRPELVKEAKIKVLLRKEAVDTYSLEKLSAFYVTTLNVKVPSDAKNSYLTIVDGLPYLNERIGNDFITSAIAISDKTFCTLDSKQERIDDQNKILDLIESGVHVFTKTPNDEIRVQV